MKRTWEDKIKRERENTKPVKRPTSFDPSNEYHMDYLEAVKMAQKYLENKRER